MAKGLANQPDEWKYHYHWYRPPGFLNGETPMHEFPGLFEKTELSDEVYHTHDRTIERIQVPKLQARSRAKPD
jgi:hypothetical protein